MSSAGVDAILFLEPTSPSTLTTDDAFEQSFVRQHERIGATSVAPAPLKGPRRTPRRSLIVVLPENHVVSPDVVSNSLAAQGDNELVDVILACAGQPHGLGALQRRIRDLQVLLAPAGTSKEDLREFAMSQAPGDIVTLLSGIPATG
jgi:hypothetical protein